MTAIAGISMSSQQPRVSQMLNVISYRGKSSPEIFESDGITLGIVPSTRNFNIKNDFNSKKRIADEAGRGHMAEAKISNGKIELRRDELGVAPLYYDIDPDGTVFFASEVKALLSIKKKPRELLPGQLFKNGKIDNWYLLEKKNASKKNLSDLTKELKRRLEHAISERISGDQIGSWLSGGLDSSTIVTLAKPYIKTFHTFVAGFNGAEDLEYAKEVAKYIGSVHHEIIVTIKDLIHALPSVIFHLESFDALLVRSSITNFLVSKAASDFVSEVFSGEAGDEFFAGYHYLKSLPSETLDDELINISKSLHNTALQRVDRCASAHGMTAHVIFADPFVFEFALQIPINYKLNQGIEKWILRRAMDGTLPEKILNRPKAKFWEGAGIGSILSDYADIHITDQDFKRERNLPNGWMLNSKEELMYYRIFKDHFSEIENQVWLSLIHI
jgi:asparagine synthase (glutamine-hydrolysing)